MIKNKLIEKYIDPELAKKIYIDVQKTFGFVKDPMTAQAVYILPNGKILDTKGPYFNHQHENVANYIKEKYKIDDLNVDSNGSKFMMTKVNAVRLTPWMNAFYIPRKPITEAQQNVLKEFIEKTTISRSKPLLVADLGIEQDYITKKPEDVDLFIQALMMYYADGIIDFGGKKNSTLFEGSNLIKCVSTVPHRGATFIMPSGGYVWAKGEDHPGLIDLLGYDTDEESIIDEKGWIRCDSGLSFSPNNLPASFIEVPEKEITERQYEALLDWMVKCCAGDEFQISRANGDFKAYDMDYYGPEDLIKIIKYYYKTGALKESLVEDTRTALINKSKNKGQYKDQSKGKNRFERKKYSKVASAVKSYNQIDMNDFFKQDSLLVKIPVTGETDTYIVSIKMEGVCSEIAKNVKNNKNKFEFRTVIQALTKVFNSANIYINCTCSDHRYNFDHWNIVNNVSTSDTAHDPGPGKGEANPNDDKGRGCKHTLLVLANGDWLMKVASVINNYVHYAEQSMQKAFLKIIFPKIYGIQADEMLDQDLIDDPKFLDSSTGLIDAINEYGANRGKFQKGSNKNPVAQKEREKAAAQIADEENKDDSQENK